MEGRCHEDRGRSATAPVHGVPQNAERAIDGHERAGLAVLALEILDRPLQRAHGQRAERILQRGKATANRGDTALRFALLANCHCRSSSSCRRLATALEPTTAFNSGS